MYNYKFKTSFVRLKMPEAQAFKTSFIIIIEQKGVKKDFSN